MNHYETLGVDKDATPEQIKAAYRALASKHHPDKGGDHDKFVAIQTAYDTLISPERRSEYEQSGGYLDEVTRTAEKYIADMIIEVVTKKTDNVDVLLLIEENITSQGHAIRSRLRELRKMLKRLRKATIRLSKSSKSSLAGIALKGNIQNIVAEWRHMRTQRAIANRVRELLLEYEYTYDPALTTNTPRWAPWMVSPTVSY